MTIRPTRRLAAAGALVFALAVGGCGKKGAPQPPFVRIPAAVDSITAARFGNRIYLTLTVPAANVDMSVPVDIARVEVYGYTGTIPPSTVRWVELGDLVATVPVVAPSTAAGTSPSVAPVDAAPDSASPGAVATLVDVLEPGELVQGRSLAPATASTPAALRRFYIAIPFSSRGRPGPPGKVAELPLTALPEPPIDLSATYNATSVSLTWEPSGGLLGFLFERRLPEEIVPFDVLEPARPTPAQDVSALVGPTTYQVYRDEVRREPVAPAVARSLSWGVAPPAALNPTPLSMASATDAIDFGLERCYTVRAQRGGVLSEPSQPLCVTPVDRFPPAPPAGLAAVPSEGAINLIWEPNTESDLGGYLILRRGPGDATLRQLTNMPITDARYRDGTVESGMRYTYAVVAVDSQPTPNASAPSAAVEDVAR